jgi:cellulose synthase/poly-beta-1,6-N-acetylglucosamine synthase-like glycosyltransferase
MSMSLLMIVLAVGLFLFDFQNLLARWRGRTLGPSARGNYDFTIVVPLYGDPKYFANREHLLRYQANVLVAIDVGKPAMEQFAGALELEGWKVFRTTLEHPGPPTLMRAALLAVTTTYVLRMDADTRPIDDIALFIESMANDGADLCSTKVLVDDPRSSAQRFQALEYRMAMLSRHFRPWLTSGACFVATTDAMTRILDSHSMWFTGEDIETGRIGFAFRMRLRHLDLRVATEAPGGWAALYRQRRMWWAGSFRHTIVNLDRNALQLPAWSFYYVALVWTGVYFKWASLVSYLHPFVLVQTMLALFAVYAAVTLVANWQVRSWRMLVFPPYALLQSILMPFVGSIHYVVLARRYGRLGRYEFGHRRLRLA